MSDPKEFCAGVRILIERMQTNPEDFAEDEMDLANMRRTKVYKFSTIAKYLERIVTGDKKEDVLRIWAEWHYLTKAEQDALTTAFKNMRRVEFDKHVMERVFDDKFYERQDEENQQHVMSQIAQQQMHAQVRAQQLQAQNSMTGISPLAQGTLYSAQPGSFVQVGQSNNVSGGFFGFLGRGKKKK